MNKILSVDKVGDALVLNCDFTDKIGTPAGFKIRDSNGDVFEIREYMYESFTPCFSEKEVAPSIVTKIVVPEHFLQPGNFIEKIAE